MVTVAACSSPTTVDASSDSTDMPLTMDAASDAIDTSLAMDTGPSDAIDTPLATDAASSDSIDAPLAMDTGPASNPCGDAAPGTMTFIDGGFYVVEPDGACDPSESLPG